ncbi:hypothetical protein K435DRAFT_802873 [Dendrothele bispora CBS 962.96]|uniref:TPR-like protein n=1 Tax=Dendrothele bispora (strain CBS 962.96) TaxID=1314807 RepID=A0A4S8LJC8_DENBC|nr:hypothetical protein K435DRAFT_802873 [Dendrothele bispora CBS 962.96]
MSESDILLEGLVVNLAAAVEETVNWQFTPGYHEDEDAEPHMAIRMSLEKPNAETTEYITGDNMPIDKEEQAELDQALFLSNLPPDICDEQLAELHQSRVNGAKSVQDLLKDLVNIARRLLEHDEPDAVSNFIRLMHQQVGLAPDGRKALMIQLLLWVVGRVAPDGSDLKASLVQVLSDIESETKVGELHSSAVQLVEHFQQSGDWTAIDNAVQLMEEVVKLTPDGHTEKVERFGNLGNALQRRFGGLGDIENAIHVYQQAVDLTPDGHALKAALLNNLGGAFSHRFEHPDR